MTNVRNGLILQGTKWVSSDEINRLRKYAEDDPDAQKALHRAEHRSGKLRYESGVRLYAYVIEDGYLSGVDRVKASAHYDYWDPYHAEERPSRWAVYRLDVPNWLASKLWKQNTPEQEFNSGYEAWDAAKKYRVEITDFGGHGMPEVPELRREKVSRLTGKNRK